MGKYKWLGFILIGIFFNLSHANTPISDKELLASVEKVPPPPKSINDLVKLLDAAKPDIDGSKKTIEIANSKPPATENREELYLFYKSRARAAEELGRTKQLLEDCKKEIEYVNPANKNQFFDAQRSCIQADFLDGNIIAAIDKLKQAIAQLPPNQMYGRHLAFQMLLINAHRSMGDLAAAEVSMREVDGLIVMLRRSNSWSEWGDNWTYQAERARGEYLSIAGKHVAAELAYVRALSALDNQIAKLESGAQSVSDRRISTNLAYFSRGIVLWRLGNSLLVQRKLVEAEYQFRSSLKNFLKYGSRNSTSVAGLLNSLAYCISEQGRVAEATLLTQYAYQVMTETGVSQTSVSMLNTRRALAAAYVNAGQYKQAVDQFAQMRAALDADLVMKERYKNLNDLDEVVAQLQVNNPSRAEQIVKIMYNRNLSSVGPKHPRTAWTQAFYAMSLEEQGESAQAYKHFSSALPILIDQARNDSENQTISLKFQKRFNMVIESYIGVLFAQAKGNSLNEKELISQAFQLADMARGSSVQRALTQSTARSNIKDPRLEQLARKEQDLQRRANSLSELLVALSAAPPERQLPAIQAKMKEDIEALKAERNSVKKEIENKYPEYFDLVEPKPITVARTARILKPKEVLVTWYFGDKKSYVWAIHQKGLDGYSILPVTKAIISKDVEHLRKALDPGVSGVDEIPPFDVALSYKLYTQLIKPVEASLKDKELLISIPHASLGQLPIATFLTEVIKQPGKGANSFIGYQNAPWLMRKIAISQLPSVNALAALRGFDRKANPMQNFIAFADPYFSKEHAGNGFKQSANHLATRGIPLNLRNAPKTSKVSSAELALLPPLPDTSLEVKEIAKVLGANDEDIYLHEKASVKKVLATDFSKKSIVMFSTHGLVPGELDGLTQPALALSSPEVTGEGEGDGLLTMDKILELKLNADWVVLSACNTASGDGNSEAVSGLGRAFFYAGARALLVSNWPVDTVASRQLMTDLFKRQNQDTVMSKPEALRQSMLYLADKGGYKDSKSNAMSYAYAHPLFWAPFVVVGD